MKRPSPTGQTHLVFAPVAFLRRLAALVPPPRANLVRYFGVFAPKARVRPRVVPALPPPVGEPSVGQSREPLERQGPPGAVVAHPLEARDVVLVEPGVGMDGEALNEGTAAPPPASGRTGPAPGHLDAFELQDVERSVRRCLLLQHARARSSARVRRATVAASVSTSASVGRGRGCRRSSASSTTSSKTACRADYLR